MSCGCNGVKNGSSTSVLEINSAPITTCGAPQCAGSFDPCSDGVPPATPVPYYLQAPSVQQTNCQTFVSEQFSTTVKTSTAWNVPECGGVASATFTLPNVTSVLVGSNLWNESYGYFEVTSWNPATQQVTVVNNCITGNAAAGTSIPACSEFLVDGPVCDCSGGTSTGLFVALDFTAPPASSCLNITVTGVEGLVVGKNVQIGTGTYRVSAIVSNEIITICNDGAGITPGTPVFAKNGAGNYQYPITLIDSNPCTNPAKPQGALLICDGSGLSQPLDGNVLGTIPVLVDTTTNAVQFRAVDIPLRICTALTAVLTYVPAVAAYVLNVADSSGFIVGDVLQVGTGTERLTVTGLPSATQISVTVSPVPGAIVNIPIGTSVCQQYCCDTVLDIALCLPQKIIGALPLNFYQSAALTFPGNIPSFEQRIFDGATECRINVPEGDCPGQTYRLTAEASLYALTAALGGIVPPIIMHECELAWVVGAAAPIGTRTENKMVWTSYGFDTILEGGGSPAIPPTPPSTQAAIWAQLIGNALGAPNDRSLLYHGGVLRSSRTVVAGEVIDLALIYKMLVGNNSTGTFFPTQFMISGIWELMRI